MCIYEHDFVTNSGSGLEGPNLSLAFRVALIVLSNPYLKRHELSCSLHCRIMADPVQVDRMVRAIRKDGQAEVATFPTWQQAVHKAQALHDYGLIHYGQPLISRVALTY